MIGNSSDNSSSKPCFACYNKTPFSKLINCFQGEPKEFSPDLVNSNPGMFTQGHLMCMFFHREAEIITFYDSKSKKNTAVAIGMRKIKKDCYLEDCSICNRSHPMQCMIPCAMKNCEKYFHYECAFKSKDLKKLKIPIKGRRFEMYGCSCARHDMSEVEQNLKEQLGASSVEVLKDFSELTSTDLMPGDKLFVMTESGSEALQKGDMDIETEVVKELEPYNTFEDFLDDRKDEKAKKEPAHNQGSNGISQHQMAVEGQEKGEIGNKEKRELIFSNYLKQHESENNIHMETESSPKKNDEYDTKGNAKRKKKGKK